MLRLCFYILRPKFVPIIGHFVKVLFFISFYSLKTIVVAGVSEENIESIILGIGEHRPLIVDSLKKISISNRDCLSYKFLKKNELWILAKKSCFCEILIQDNSEKIKKYHVYIISKHDQLNYQSFIREAAEMGLKAQWKGELLYFSGEIKSLEDYYLIHKLKEKIGDKGIFNITIQGLIWRTLSIDIYQELFQNYVDLFQCRPEGIEIICTVSESNSPGKELLNKIKDKFKVNFILSTDEHYRRSYSAKIIFFQMTKADGSYFDLGFESLYASLGQIYNQKSLMELIKSNDAILQKEKISFGLLAEPEVTFNLDEDIEIALGEETPFQTMSLDGRSVNLDWKFTGLLLKFKLSRFGEKFKLHYKIMFQKNNRGESTSSTTQQQTKEESTLYLKSEELTKLFEIGLVSKDTNTTALPFISNVPGLGNLFKDERRTDIFKKISGHFILKELNL